MKLNPLILNLEKQLQFHSDLLEVLEQEIVLPVSCEVEEIETLQEKKGTFAQKLADKEITRKLIIQKIAVENGFDPQITLKEIIKKADNHLKFRLEKIYNRLLEIVKKIQEVSKEVFHIARSRVKSVQEIQFAVHRSFHRQSLYSQTGEITIQQGGCLVRKEV